MTYGTVMGYIAQVPNVERRSSFPAALGAGALMAQKANGYGGKRPPKEQSEDPPLRPDELFTALEMAVMHMPELVPFDILEFWASGEHYQSCTWLTPSQAEDLMLAMERDIFVNDEFEDYSEVPVQGDFEDETLEFKTFESRWLNRAYQGSRFNPELFFASVLARDWLSITARSEQFVKES
jgi:hypothetical protein